jgi:hypothetical protein
VHGRPCRWRPPLTGHGLAENDSLDGLDPPVALLKVVVPAVDDDRTWCQNALFGWFWFRPAYLGHGL